MKKKDFMEKLLDGKEVKWEPLGKVLVRTKGTKITAGRMKELHKDGAPLKIFAGGKTIAFVDFKDIPEKNINREPSIIVKSRGVIEFEYYDNPFSHKSEMWSYHSKNEDINIKFVYYFLKMHELYFQNLASRMQMPQIATPDTDKFLIPIPSPTIQTEIVRILDNFTELTAELTAELRARKKQYSYYRDQLLSFEEGEVEWKSLGDIVIIKNGKDWKKLNKGDIPVYGSGGVMAYVDKSSYNNVSVLIPRKGTITNIFYVEKAFWNVDTIFYTEINEDILIPKYFYYFMSNFNIETLSTDSTRPSLTQTILKKIKIPIPPLEKQKCIVEILDKFDTLTHSISEGLPKEIELRQKQYEYYRDMLLNFSKPEVEA